jgi:hypothetical protein
MSWYTKPEHKTLPAPVSTQWNTTVNRDTRLSQQYPVSALPEKDAAISHKQWRFIESLQHGTAAHCEVGGQIFWLTKFQMNVVLYSNPTHNNGI